MVNKDNIKSYLQKITTNVNIILGKIKTYDYKSLFLKVKGKLKKILIFLVFLLSRIKEILIKLYVIIKEISKKIYKYFYSLIKKIDIKKIGQNINNFNKYIFLKIKKISSKIKEKTGRKVVILKEQNKNIKENIIVKNIENKKKLGKLKEKLHTLINKLTNTLLKNLKRLKLFIFNNKLLIVSIIFLSFSIYLANTISVSSFEQCLYAIMKIEGASSDPLLYCLFYNLFLFVILFIITFIVVKVIDLINNKKILKFNISKNIIGTILIFISIFSAASVSGVFPFIKNTVFASTNLFDKYYVDAKNTKITFPEKKKNLIYIYVESGEMSNISKENGGLFNESLIPNMEKLALDNINFSNTDKLGGALESFGSGWTAAGMFGTTSGLPLKIKLSDFKGDSTKFLNIKTLGDILKDNGYDNYLNLGSDASFGGRRAYFSNHEYIIDDYIRALNDGRLASDYFKWWGYEDSKLFSIAKDNLRKISKNNRPFNYTMLTSNTHFTDGFTEESCEHKFENEYANSFYCFDSLLNNFLNEIKEEDYYEDTVIIITGDHHTMQSGFYEKDDKNKRTIYNVIINSDTTYYNNKNRIFTSLDMFPTTLASLGASIKGDRLGLGTNLFSNMDTIPELMGLDTFNEELMKYSNKYYKDIRKAINK